MTASMTETESENHAFPPPFVVSPTAPYTHTLFLLHGRGDSGPSFGSGVYIATPSSGFPLAALYPGMKFVFPTTAARYSTCFREYMNEWFDVVSLSFPEEHAHLQRQGLREAVAHVTDLIEAEMAAGIPADCIFIGGISQGCATALHVLLSLPRRIGGFVGMSGWLPFASNIRATCNLKTGAGLRTWQQQGRLRDGGSVASAGSESDDMEEETQADGDGEVGEPMHIDAVLKLQSQRRQNKYPLPTPQMQTEALVFVRQNLNLPTEEVPLDTLRTPVFLGHGDCDQTVDYELGRNMYTTLKYGLGMDVKWKRYRNFGHWYKEPDEFDDIIEFWGEKCGLLPS